MTILTAEQIANRRRWAQALESSRKAKRNLVDDAGRECCLGVACRVLAGKTRNEMRWKGLPGEVGVSLLDLAGVPFIERYDLATLNDGDGDLRDYGVAELSHREIALYLYLTAEAGIA